MRLSGFDLCMPKPDSELRFLDAQVVIRGSNLSYVENVLLKFVGDTDGEQVRKRLSQTNTYIRTPSTLRTRNAVACI